MGRIIEKCVDAISVLFGCSRDVQVEHTLVLLKPDALRRGLEGTLVAILLNLEGVSVVAIKRFLEPPSWDLLKKHYIAHKGKWYYFPNIRVMRGQVLALVLEGPNIIQRLRDLAGDTNPAKAKSGTIRGDFGIEDMEEYAALLKAVHNLIHTSEDPEQAKREIALWFPNLVHVLYG